MPRGLMWSGSKSSKLRIGSSQRAQTGCPIQNSFSHISSFIFRHLYGERTRRPLNSRGFGRYTVSPLWPRRIKHNIDLVNKYPHFGADNIGFFVEFQMRFRFNQQVPFDRRSVHSSPSFTGSSSTTASPFIKLVAPVSVQTGSAARRFSPAGLWRWHSTLAKSP